MQMSMWDLFKTMQSSDKASGTCMLMRSPVHKAWMMWLIQTLYQTLIVLSTGLTQSARLTTRLSDTSFILSRPLLSIPYTVLFYNQQSFYCYII